MKWYFLFVLCLFGCHKKQTESVSVPITAFQVVAQTIPSDYEYVGVAKSSHIVELRARVEGYLEKITYQEGGLVHEGDTLFVIDQRPFIAALDMTQGDLLRQKAILWNAGQIKNRMEPLYQEKAVSQKDFDDAVSQELAAQAELMIAEANVEKAQINLGFTTIQSPVTGMASLAKYREGALISPGCENLLTTMYVIDPMWIDFSVSSMDLLHSRKLADEGKLNLPQNNGFTIEVVLSNGSTLPAEGKIDFSAPSYQQSTGTMLFRAVLANPNGLLLPGEFVRVKVMGAERPNAIFVPKTAIMQGSHGTFVYVIENNEAKIRSVELGSWYQDYWIVLSGLKEGDVVISLGTNKVTNHTPVVIKNWSQEPQKPSS